MKQADINKIRAEADGWGLDWRFIVAIYAAENGPSDSPKGIPFGVMAGSHQWDDALKLCCGIVQKLIIRATRERTIPQQFETVAGQRGHSTMVYSVELIKAIGRHYAPVGADNDPHNLNVNWVPNVVKYYYAAVSHTDAFATLSARLGFAPESEVAPVPDETLKLIGGFNLDE